MSCKYSINVLLILVCLTSSIFAQKQDVNILVSNTNLLEFEYTPLYSDSAKVFIDNKPYQIIQLIHGNLEVGTTLTNNAGMPNVMQQEISITVPSEVGNVVEVIKSEFKEINQDISPIPKYAKENGLSTAKYILGKDYSNYKAEEELIKFGNFGLAGSLPVQTLVLMPIKYFPQQHKIRIYTKLVVRVHFGAQKSQYSIKVNDLNTPFVINSNVIPQFFRIEQKLRKSITNSVLSSGTWYRFEAPAEGMYKISKSDLVKFEIPDNVDPRTIKIFNNSGKQLSESVTANSPTDLVENAIYVEGESDGKFDANDFILFYGRGQNFADYDTTKKAIIRSINQFTNHNYYWITFGGAAGKRMEIKNSDGGSADLIQTTTTNMMYLNQEKVNLVRSGRVFVGDEFTANTKSRTYLNKLDGVIPNTPILYKYEFVNSGQNQVLLSVQDNNTVISQDYVQGISYAAYSDYQAGLSVHKEVYAAPVLQGDRSALKFTFNISDAGTRGYINYFEIFYNRDLTAVNDELYFFSKDTTGIIDYNLNGFSNSKIKVFDVTNFANAKIVNPYLLSGSEFKFKASEKKGMVSKYYSEGNETYKTVSAITKVENQNVGGISTGAKVIVITNKLFLPAAKKYVQYREQSPKNKLSCQIVDIDEIMNEFNGGNLDPSALRNFIKYAYNNWQVTPEYVILFGNGTFDYKNIEGTNQNFVLTYQFHYTNLDNNLSSIDSYCTDDFFVKVAGADELVDLAIGRLPFRNLDDAYNYTDKVASYESNNDLGEWRNTGVLVADDGYTNQGYTDGPVHTDGAETIYRQSLSNSVQVNKIYMATYPVELTGNGRRMPQVTKDILSAINNGCLFLDFIGHGSPNVWTHEYVVEKETFVPQMVNTRLFFMLAGTCDFGLYDDANVVSGGEMFVLKKASGSIVTFTSARVAFSSESNSLLASIFRALYLGARDTNNLPVPFGKVVQGIKLTAYGVNDKKYHILGDPTLRMDIPQYQGKINTINDITVATTTANVKALSKVNVKGNILNNGSLWSNYSGEGVLSVYDATRSLFVPSISYTISVSGGTIFKGRVSVKNGTFSGDFTVPKDISYENNYGRMTFYFNNTQFDGLGFTTNFIVGGSDTSTITDKNGPEIKAYFDKDSYTNTYLVNKDANLIVELKDESGLNTTSNGVGHKLEGILNGDPNKSIDFSNYFTGDLDAGGKSGKVSYPLENLEPGKYTLQVKAWDIFNNYSTSNLEFNLLSDNTLEISDVYNYPNPFSNKTTFTFQQSIKTPIDVKIKIYTVAGRLIKELEEYGVSKGFVTVDWDGRDNDGNQIANGVYLYKILVKSMDGINKTALGKLAIIR